MEQNYKTNSFKKLLDRLQEDSWQLELLISGFAIFGLFYALEPVYHQLLIAQIDNNQVFLVIFFGIYFSLQILIFNLLLHVLLRGVWIGTLGLRYVFGEIEFENLNYSDQFTKYLKRKVGSLDDYISKLENFCSVIFALTFLLVFYIFTFFIIVFIIFFIIIPFINSSSNWVNIAIISPLILFFGIGLLLTFFDFITQGLLKKNKWVAKIYFPFYWVFGFLTLSFLYRPLIYNLLDNKIGKRISYLMIPIYISVYMVFHLHYQKSNFITNESTKDVNTNVSFRSNYEDIIEKKDNVFIRQFAIQSKVITTPYVKLIVPLNSAIEDSLIEFNALLKPIKDKRGLYFRPEISFFITEPNHDTFVDEYLNTFETYYSFKIDTTTYETDFVITKINSGFAFESYIGIQGLSEGKHIIEFQSLKHKDSDSLVSIRKVPFWYYK